MAIQGHSCGSGGHATWPRETKALDQSIVQPAVDTHAVLTVRRDSRSSNRHLSITSAFCNSPSGVRVGDPMVGCVHGAAFRSCRQPVIGCGQENRLLVLSTAPGCANAQTGSTYGFALGALAPVACAGGHAEPPWVAQSTQPLTPKANQDGYPHRFSITRLSRSPV